jgi:hypothetical protein
MRERGTPSEISESTYREREYHASEHCSVTSDYTLPSDRDPLTKPDPIKRLTQDPEHATLYYSPRTERKITIRR